MAPPSAAKASSGDRAKPAGMATSQTRIFPGRYESLNAITRFFADAAQTAGLDARAVYAVQVAVDEACSNIIEHAYGGQGDCPICCTYHITDLGLTVVLHDHGRPFDPSSVSEPDLECDLEERCVGGLGMHLIRQLMDKVQFEFTQSSGNTLTMVKFR